MKTLLTIVLAWVTLTTVRAQNELQLLTIHQTETAGSSIDRTAVAYIIAHNTVEQRAHTRYTAGQTITLQPGFTAQAGSVFVASIGQSLAKTTRPEIKFSAKAYPNPFQQTTTIEYILPQAGQVSLTLIDEQGHILQQEISSREAGRQELNLTGTALTQGTYFYQVRVNNQQQTIRLLKTH